MRMGVRAGAGKTDKFDCGEQLNGRQHQVEETTLALLTTEHNILDGAFQFSIRRTCFGGGAAMRSCCDCFVQARKAEAERKVDIVIHAASCR